MPTDHLNTYDLKSIENLKRFKGFKLISLNVRSLLPKINILRLDMVNTDADVFTLSETWLKPTVCDRLLKLKDYCLIRSDRTTRNVVVLKLFVLTILTLNHSLYLTVFLKDLFWVR